MSEEPKTPAIPPETTEENPPEALGLELLRKGLAEDPESVSYTHLTLPTSDLV